MTSIELARSNKHHELAVMLEGMTGRDYQGGDGDEKKLEDERDGDDDQFPLEILDRLGLKTGDNEWILKWISIMKRSLSNWKSDCPIFGVDLKRELEEIEKEFRGIHVTPDGRLPSELIECVHRNRDKILHIFEQIKGLYRDEILLCIQDEEYMAFLKHFMSKSKEFGKFEGSGDIYDLEHERAKIHHQENSSWCLEPTRCTGQNNSCHVTLAPGQ